MLDIKTLDLLGNRYNRQIPVTSNLLELHTLSVLFMGEE